jgi:exopolysaccharide biosynthesis protein
MRLRRRTWIGIVLLATALVCFLVLPVRSRGLTRISDTGSREYTNRIATAVNVYARKGVAPSVKYTRGTFNGKRYDALIVTPSDTTFIQLDYAGDDPQYLDSLEDTALLAQGYWRVGGINGGFFNNNEPDYGRPTGAVLVDGVWQLWRGEELTPAYGNGNATVYFNRDGGLKVYYHGWQNGIWMTPADTFWSYDSSVKDYTYHIFSRYGLSGAYTLLKDGRRTWLGRAQSAYPDCSKDTSVTLFGESADGRILLVTARNIGGIVQETALMQQLGAVTAIRLDGSTSTGMCVDKGLVNR